MISSLLKNAYHLAVYIIGVCVLLIAVIATGVRLFLPDIGMYRSEIEAWVSNYTDLPVAIHTVEADWQGWTPRLYLDDIDLLSSNGIYPIVNFSRAEISIDLLSTLVHRRIVPQQLTLSGFRIGVIREVDGSIDIEGIRVENYQEQTARNDELANWLLGQNLIELQDIRIDWVDRKLGQEPVSLTDANLKLRSDGRRLQVEGSTLLPEDYGESMRFAIDLTGNILTSAWTAEVYIHGENINPDSWYRSYWPPEISVAGGNATTSVWSSWDNARLTAINGQLEYNDFHMVLDENNSFDIEQLSYRFSGNESTKRSWIFNLQLDSLVTANGSWPESYFSLLIEPLGSPDKYRYSANFSYLKLDDISPILESLSSIPQDLKQIPDGYKLSGDLYDSSMYFNPEHPANEKIQFNLEFDRLSLQKPSGTLPVSTISGKARGTAATGKFVFDDDSAVIDEYLDNDILPGQIRLDGKLGWSFTDGNILLSPDRLNLSNSDFSAMLSGTINFAGKSPFVDLVANIDQVDYLEALKYLPDTHKFRIKNWIRQAISGGRLESIGTVFRGNLEHFPFDNSNGQYKVIARVADANLKYSVNWPAINSIDADLIFTGRELKINIGRGRVYNSTIDSGIAIIPDLGAPYKTVNIDGAFTGDTASLINFVHDSPLDSNLMLNRISNYLSADGEANLELNLSVPIRTPGIETVINGKLDLARASLTTDIDNLEFTGIDGEVAFTRHSVAADDISATLNGHPVKLAIGSSQGGFNTPVTVTISGTGDKEYITNQLDTFFPRFSFENGFLTDSLTGTTTWQASMTYITRQQDKKLERIFSINTDLYGMSVNLPHPFGKHPYLRTALQITKSLDDPAKPLEFRYGDLLSSEIVLAPDKGLEKLSLNFGNVMQAPPYSEGIVLYGEIDALPLSEWLALLPDDINTRNDQGLPVHVDLRAKNLSLSGQTFADTSLLVQNATESWYLLLDGPSVKGEITAPTSPDNDNPVILNLEYLRLQKPDSGNGNQHLSPADIPAISANIGEFNFSDMDFGSLSFSAITSENGLMLKNIQFTKPSLTMRADGQWVVDESNNHISDFSIQAHAAEFSNMLEPFGYNMAGINRGETHLTIDANWNGTPLDFSLDRLNGALSMQIGQGQLVDLEPAAGRLFGLLSLQTLPRRLLLDFSDILGKGMAFDQIQGSFLIENGNAYTEDLAMKGPSVDILITGRAGLSVRDYDQKAIVTPQISDSLAVASGFLGPVGVGLGTVLYLAGNMFEPLQDSINKLLKYEYSITGSWDDPVVEQYKVVQKDSG